MANIPGTLGYVQPDVFSRVRTLQRATSIPGGLRILCIVGEGLREETLVSSAVGNGEDGFNPDFVSASDGYGRYFKTSLYPLISNRSVLLLNGSPLRILESSIDAGTFSSLYDARLDITNGHIELQRASLVDQGGALYLAGSNVGDGYLSVPVLTDSNAPTETWTVRCTSTLKDSYGAPIRGQASFIATGSVSGQLKDAYGQPFIWRSDGAAINNGILSFAVYNPTGAVFQVGDRFTIKVASRVLRAQDRLEIRYIAEIDLNDPEIFTDSAKLYEKHGQPSLTNALSLGAQMAFENGATSVLALQAKPPIPRRTSEVVLAAINPVTNVGGAAGTATADDLIFPITLPGKPDFDTIVHFFVIGVDGVETQIFPNKVDFYDPDITAAFSNYETTGSTTLLDTRFMDPSQTGMPYSYTVVSDDEIEQSANDGYVSSTGISIGRFSSLSASFTADDVGKTMDFHNTLTVNEGRYTITAVVDVHTVDIVRASGNFISESNLKWQLISAAGDSQRVLLTNDLALAAGQGLRITYIDQRDADFFDVGWFEALDKLESQDLQILVLLPQQTFSAIQQAGRVHVERMSDISNKRERVLFTGSLQGLTPDNVTGVSQAAVEDIGVLEGIQGDDVEEILDGNIEDLANYGVANSFGDTFRVMYFYPDEIVRLINGTRELIPGYYMAAAAAGRVSGTANVADPLTFKPLVGFDILNNKVFKQTVLNKLGDNGIAVVQPITGGGRVLHGKMTTQSGAPEEEEMSIVFVRDHLARTLRRTLQPFIGVPEDPTLISSITAKVVGVINAFISQNLLTAQRNLSVTRDDVEPRQINIRIEVQPAYPTNWIFTDVSIGLLL